GFDGLWLSLAIGVVAAVVVAVWAGPICAVFGASPEAVGHATSYLRISAAGIPAMLAVLAVTGVLRGLQDTRTPLVVSVLAFSTNVALNLAFVYGLGLGIVGSAWGTVLAQTGMALALVTVVTRHARRLGARLAPHPVRVLRAARDGVPLMLRTIALRATLLTATWVAARQGDIPLAAYQVSMTVWTFLVFALDALAIAGQALTGRSLGAGDVAGTRAMTTLMIRWGIGAGVGFGLAVAALAGVLPAIFTSDPATRAAIGAALLAVAAAQPLSGWVFVLDGVLIGAGDNRFLAWAQSVAFAAYAPVAWATYVLSDRLATPGARVQLLWWGVAVWMLVRGVLLQRRASGTAWLRTGAVSTSVTRGELDPSRGS
ncbi:MAG TPA: MATE family efflux transporter, partial [Candidatus Lustribacter sp.]|nr:MATE family efflux transporter [Candidatus Lustribacter sp.]